MEFQGRSPLTSTGCLTSLMAKGESFGYRVENTGDNTHEGTHYWFGDFIKETVLNLVIVNE